MFFKLSNKSENKIKVNKFEYLWSYTLSKANYYNDLKIFHDFILRKN